MWICGFRAQGGLRGDKSQVQSGGGCTLAETFHNWAAVKEHILDYHIE